MPDPKISADDKHRECRELKLRYNVYPKLVAEGKLSQRQADRQIAVMEEIAADYRALTEQKELVFGV